MRKSNLVRKLTIVFLALQGFGTLIWWTVLVFFPVAREPFRAPAAPDATLLAFFVPDLLLFGGGALMTAYSLFRQSAWAWPGLCVIAGAAAYASLYAVSLPLLSGAGWPGALMMLPSLVVLPAAVWLLRPESAL